MFNRVKESALLINVRNFILSILIEDDHKKEDGFLENLIFKSFTFLDRIKLHCKLKI